MSEVANNRDRTQIMTIQEMAKYLGFHEITIYRLIKSKQLPAFKIGRRWRIMKSVLDQWLLERSQSVK